MISRADGIRLAFRHIEGKGPTIVFLPGYRSDMLGSKAEALARWAEAHGQAFLRFDYSGCGESEGQFETCSLAHWLDDALAVIAAQTEGPLILVGSSMGGWLMLHVAVALKERIAGLVGIAAAPDFTQWGFSQSEKAQIAQEGRLERASDYGPEPMISTRLFWDSGQAMCLLDRAIALDCPVRLLQGQQDPEVPWRLALRLAEQLRSADVQVQLIKDGDHRLSRPQDIILLVRTIEALLEPS